MPPTDYYAILNISPQASQGEIKRAYRRLARKYHPDLNQQTLDQHIKLLNEAYYILGNPAKRATYDQQRLLQEQRRQEERQAAQEALRRQQEQAKQKPRMTWIEGIFGFVRELKKELRDP